MDRPEYPAPAIRFKENTADVMALREKEKGDWKNLSLEDKKACKYKEYIDLIIIIECFSKPWTES